MYGQGTEVEGGVTRPTEAGPRAGPTFSVVVATFNRADLLPRAVSSILRQRTEDLELILVDDGSTDQTPAVLASFADPRVRVVRQDNAGLSVARNTGVTVARGEWVTFLDDDDEAYAWWLEGFSESIDTPSCAVVCCGLDYVRAGQIETKVPSDLGVMFDHARGLFQAGTFCVRSDVFRQVGGFLPGLRCSHHTELSLRLVPYCQEHGLAIRCMDRPGVRIHVGHPSARPMASPAALLSGTLAICDRHGSLLQKDPTTRADYLSIAGVSAFRLGSAGQARRLLFDAARCRRTSPRHWARLALSLVPPVARRVWRVRDFTAVTANSGGDIANTKSPLFLPSGYRENTPVSSETGGQLFWAEPPSQFDLGKQRPVYRLARKLAAELQPTVIADIGCGTGYKLVHQLGDSAPRVVGIDQGSAIEHARQEFPDREWLQLDLEDDEQAWQEIAALAPDLVLCVDVIEHVVSPIALLTHIRDVLTPSSRLVLSTPDRSRIDGAAPLGPPGNPRHVREWTEAEMHQLLASCGLAVEQSVHLLPRRYFPTVGEARRLVGRLRRGMAIPDRRYSMAFVCRLPPPLAAD